MEFVVHPTRTGPADREKAPQGLGAGERERREAVAGGGTGVLTWPPRRGSAHTGPLRRYCVRCVRSVRCGTYGVVLSSSVEWPRASCPANSTWT
jgi:hypothetical protein